ncbi:ATPase AAA [Actinomycetota bacterium]|nr:ATPase AAA [Actinomycetota bacterium]
MKVCYNMIMKQNDISNPFIPTFGVSPSIFVGRSRLVDEFMVGLASPIGNPHRASIFTGPRGSGKTTLLFEIKERASFEGWVTIKITANENLLDDLIEEIKINTASLLKKEGRKITGISFSGIGLSIEPTIKEDLGWRQQLSLLIDQINEFGSKVLFLIDEVQANTDKMRILATAYQDFVGSGKDIAIAMAGLPSVMSDMLNDDVLTFLRRAHHEVLENVGIAEVLASYKKTLNQFEYRIKEDALQLAAQATTGYPYLIQLIGYNMWMQSTNRTISLENVISSVEISKETMYNSVHATSFKQISKNDLKLTIAMSEDLHSSQIANILERTGWKSEYLSKYRARLIDAGIIYSPSRGVLEFTLPFTRDYVREVVLQECLDRPSDVKSIDGIA